MKNSILPTIRVSSCPESFSDEVSNRLFKLLEESCKSQESVSIALSGGKTPGPIYSRLGEKLRSDPLFFPRIRWFQTDERDVPSDHPDNNGGMILRNLFSRFPGQAAFFQVPTISETPDNVALGYEKTLREIINTRNAYIRLDLIILGMGEDGHIASLFPEEDWQRSDGRDFTYFQVKKLNSIRFSLSYPAILNSGKIVFILVGNKKGVVLRKILGENPPGTPAGMLASQKATEWWLDPQAASEISGFPISTL